MRKKSGWVLIILLCAYTFSFSKNRESDSLKIAPVTSENSILEKVCSESYVMNLFASTLYINKGIYRQKEQNYNLAILNFQEAIRLNPASCEAYKLMGETKAGLGLKSEALKDFDTAIDLNPFYADAYFTKANFFKSIGNYEEAYNNYSLAMYIDPVYTHAFVQKDLDVLSFCNFIRKNYQLNVSGK
jgi:tetratricopeptide (TPR) repeat protein